MDVTTWILFSGILLLLILLYNRNNCIKYYFRMVIYAIHFVSMSAIFLPIFYMAPDKSDKSLLFFSYIFSSLHKLFGINYEVRNEHNLINGNEASIMVKNHQSSIDFMTYCHLFSKYSINHTAVIKKKPVQFWPANTVVRDVLKFTLVNNDGTVDDLVKKNMKNMLQAAIEKKRKILFYPEGTRNTTGKILPFKKGAFKMAIDNQLPVIPVVVSPLYFFSSEKKIFNNGKIIVDILKPISTKGLTLQDMDALIENVHSKMSEKFSELQKEIAKMLADNKI